MRELHRVHVPEILESQRCNHKCNDDLKAMKTTKAFVTILLMTAFCLGHAQYQQSYRGNSFLVEIGGGKDFLYYSFNYDRILHNERYWKLSARAGFMQFNNPQGQGFGIPVDIYYFTGLKRHYLEFGLGIATLYEGLDSAFSKIFLVISPLNVGYRYQNPKTGLFVKASLSPIRLAPTEKGDSYAFEAVLAGLGLGITI